MSKINKILSFLIVLTVTLLAYFFKLPMTGAAAQSLVIFLSIAFGSQMITVTVLSKGSYFKNLHKRIDEKEQKREIHILKAYLLAGWSRYIFSIISLILFSTFSMESDFNVILGAGLWGLVALNIFDIILFLNTIIDGMVEEAKQ